MSVGSELQQLNVDSPLVELYTLDCTPIGGSVYRFTPHFADGGSVVFGGNTYSSLPIVTEGWEVSSTGTQPRPSLSVSNVNKDLLSAVISLGDIVGAKLTRHRTLAKFLDAASFTRRNLLGYSDDLRVTAEVGSTRPWFQYIDTGNAIAVSLESVTGPLGNNITVSKFKQNTAGALQRQAGQTITAPANTVYTASVYAKAAEVPRLRMVINTKVPTYPSVQFDLTTGTVVSAGAVVDRGIVSVGNGWYRCWTAVNTGTGAPTTNTLTLTLTNSTGGDYGGAIGDGVLLWGAQMELGSAPTDYQFTLADHQPYADSNAFLAPDVFEIEQKTAHNKNVITWQLSSVIDRFGTKVPRQQITRDRFPGVGRGRGAW